MAATTALASQQWLWLMTEASTQPSCKCQALLTCWPLSTAVMVQQETHLTVS